ncbi:MAG: hypothetical protein ACJ75S_07635, partial [Solirubrobacterales bacterium]
MRKTGKRRRFTIFIVILAVPILALPSTALATPFHARAKSLDIGGLNHACGAAVDFKGDLYLSNAGESTVNVYDASHTILTSIPDAHEPCGLSVTATGV